MKTHISRRSLAAGLALAPVAGLPALAGESGPTVANLWDDWRAFIADYLGATAKRDAAEKAMLRIPTKPAMHSNLKPATYTDLKPATVPI
jgi:hypothetical protein